MITYFVYISHTSFTYFDYILRLHIKLHNVKFCTNKFISGFVLALKGLLKPIQHFIQHKNVMLDDM